MNDNWEWQLGLGMHNFRRAERETLRVRSVRKVRRGDGVKSASAKVFGDPTPVGLPLANPPRRSHRRRLRKRAAPEHIDRIPVPVVKNPVKVRHELPTAVGTYRFAWRHGWRYEVYREPEGYSMSRNPADPTGPKIMTILPATTVGRWTNELRTKAGRFKRYRKGPNRKARRKAWFTAAFKHFRPDFKKVPKKKQVTGRSRHVQVIDYSLHSLSLFNPTRVKREDVMPGGTRFIRYVKASSLGFVK